MTKYWAIAPWPNNEPDIFNTVWRYDTEHGTIAIRWHQLGDLTGLPKQQIAAQYRETHGEDSAPAVKMLWDFYNEVEPEDVVIARRGRHFCIGLGRITRPAYFDLARGQARLNGVPHRYVGASFVEVEWEWLGIRPVSEPFTMNTISNIGAAKFHRILPHD